MINENELFEIFPWDKNFDTGIEKIDEQHKVLVNILNKLAAHLANLSDEFELNEIFDELADYADFHFKTEEGIWSQYFVDDVWFLEHEKTHESFIDDVVKMKENKANKDFDEVIYDIVLYLAKWLAYHILDTDKRMAKVVFAVKNGDTLQEAKNHSVADMGGSMQTLIETVLNMYSDISTRTLDLMREKSLRLRVEHKLKISEDRWKFILESNHENIWDWDVKNNTFKSSQQDVDNILDKALTYYGNEVKIHPDDLEETKKEFLKHLNGETEFYSRKHRLLNKNGAWSWVFSRAKVVSRDKDNKALRMVGTNSDITQREVASIIYKNSSQAMFISDTHNKIISVNPAFVEITGYDESDVIGKDPKILASGDMPEHFYKNMWFELRKNAQWHGEIINQKKDGTTFIEDLSINAVKNEENEVDHYVALFVDITDKKRAEDIIQEHAHFDALTKLANRHTFNTHLSQEIIRSKRTKSPFAVLFIDLDHFKDVNDNFGHTMGDDVLVEASYRIKKEIRNSDILSRFGGDEFTLIVTNITDMISLERISKNIIRSIKKPFILDENNIYLSASIGITLYPDDAKDAVTLVKNADQAMYEAKQTGRSRFQYFTKNMQEKAQVRQKLLSDLHDAIELEQLEMYYQPIVNLKDNKTLKAEALIRWNHPKEGIIYPDSFIPLAEQSGLILEIGNWVFKESAQQAHIWKDKYTIDFKVSINKSPVQFKSTHEISSWIDYLNEINLDTNNIIVEITENLLMGYSTQIENKLLQFRDVGIEVSLDDFGKGYSSLSYLKRFHIDYIKIDKSFVDNLVISQQDKILCEAMIVMAHKLDIKVVAEGIETQEQLDILTNMGCDYGQGYIYAKALKARDFEKQFLI